MDRHHLTPALLCLDLGTSGAKAALVSATGETLATAESSYPTFTQPGGGVEQDPHDWVNATREVIAALSNQHTDSHVAALTMTGQMQDLIRIDAHNNAVDNAVLYSDTRARAQAADLHEKLPEWNEITGNKQVATSCAAMWMRLTKERIEAGEESRTTHLLFSPTAFIAAQLGLGAFCDETTASATGLLDIASGTWSERICEAAGVDVAKLPTIRSGHIGNTPDNNVLGLPVGIPVILSPGDAGSTTCGMVGFTPGNDYVSFGTSGWHAQVVNQLGTPSELQQLLLPGGQILSIAAVLSVGGVADWARERLLGSEVTAQDADRHLLQTPRKPTGMIALPSLHGERYPIRSDHLGGAIIDIRPESTKASMYAAVLEGVALSLSHNISPGGTLAATGGGSRSVPWMRMLADITGRTIRITSGIDASLHGAASFAASQLGWAIIEPLSERAIIEIEPEASATAAYAPVKVRHRMLFDAIEGLPPA